MTYAAPLPERMADSVERRWVIAFIGSLLVHSLGLIVLTGGLLDPVMRQIARERVQAVELDLPEPPPPVERTPDTAPETNAQLGSPDTRKPVPMRDIRLTNEVVPMRIPELELAQPSLTIGGGGGLGGLGTGGVARLNTGNEELNEDKPAETPHRQTKRKPQAERQVLSAAIAPSMRMSRLQSYYPQDMLKERIGGVAIVECEVLRYDRVRNCTLVSETPAGRGFGEALLRAEDIIRMRMTDQRGRRVYNERARLRIFFDPESEAVTAAREENS